MNAARHRVPDLEPWCGSWIVSSRTTGLAVLETFERTTAERINQNAYRVETTAQYLGRINRAIRSNYGVAMTTTPDIAIYSVLVFRPQDDGKFESCLHYVAGTDSADAQRRILAGSAEHLTGRRFITTDDVRERDNTPDCRLYVSTLRSEAIDADTLARWVEVSIKGHWEGGDFYPPTHREF